MTCIITNCRGYAPSSEPFCAKHRDKPAKRSGAPVPGDGDDIAGQIDALYERASNNPCTCNQDENSCRYCNAWERARRETRALIEAHAAPAPSDEAGATERWRHVKRGTVYEVIGRGELQMSFDALVDGSSMVVYRGEDGKIWVREEGEFEDGRFERLEDAEAGVPAGMVPDDYVLPCDVKVPAATTIAAGCKLSTLMLALSLEGRPRKFPKQATPTDEAVLGERALGWQGIRTHPGRGKHCKCMIYSEQWGVSEGLLFDDGKWGVAAFNGQIIQTEPKAWQPLPKAPESPAPGSAGEGSDA